MLFKARFVNPVDEMLAEENNLFVEFDSVIGKEIIRFGNHDFEIERNNDALIDEITYCNQCVSTFDIEQVFIELISLLLNEGESVVLIDSSGAEEELTKEEVMEML